MAKGNLKKSNENNVTVQASVVEETKEQTTAPAAEVQDTSDDGDADDAVESTEQTAAEEQDQNDGDTIAPTITVDTEVKKKDNDKKISVQKTKSTTTKEQIVRIKMARNHKCHIGGQWYYLEAGKYYNVPENVKRILVNSGMNLLAPL